MTEQQQAASNAGLAQAMGYQLRLTMDNLPDAHVIAPDGKRLSLSELPDYFNDAAASRKLVAWLAAQEVIVKRRFIVSLHPGLSDACVFNDAPIDEDMILEAMVAEPSVIARAACKALGIEVSE